MSGRVWAGIIAEAIEQHGDAPTIEQVCGLMLKTYPEAWRGPLASLLPVVAAAELRESAKRVAYLRAAARERGLSRSMSIAGIRSSFARYTDPPPQPIGVADVLPRTRYPLLRSAAAL